MVKGSSLLKEVPASQQGLTIDYDDVKAIVKLAKKNGWDLESLDLVTKDLKAPDHLRLTRKQVSERDRLIKSVIQRFSKVLTPPVPLDLERCILKKDKAAWLPWEKEVIEKVSLWRRDVAKARTEIAKELGRAV